MASLIPPHLQMEAQREEGRVALHLQSFVKGAWVGGRAGWPRPGAEALALWQVKGPKGRLELSGAPITSGWLCFCLTTGAYVNDFRFRGYQTQSREGTGLTG